MLRHRGGWPHRAARACGHRGGDNRGNVMEASAVGAEVEMVVRRAVESQSHTRQEANGAALSLNKTGQR